MKDFIKKSIAEHLREKAEFFASEIVESTNNVGYDKFLAALCFHLHCVKMDIKDILSSKYGAHIKDIDLNIEPNYFQYSLTVYSTAEFLQGKYNNEHFSGRTITELIENTTKHLDKLI